MAIKESNDELNPLTTAVAPVLPAGRPARSVKDYLALAIATCGVGYLPLAPGTWGSLLAAGVFSYTHARLLGGSIDTPAIVDPIAFFVGLLIAIAVITFVGIWAASRTERVLKIKDPGKVVVDEVAGQLIALSPLALTRMLPVLLIITFMLFRFFDIVKPYPVRKMESLKGGLGIMADDIVAGVYAASGVALAVVISWFI